ncbi:MAG: ribosome assembly RNA-binding protein YhbY [Gammaproteobacteria bacterium]|nr:MAG: ribosome assembly RNA-binding protein YhbY [Gammaproteobacteria bacterium]
MSLSSDKIKQYRAIAHNLKPVLLIGDRGVSEALVTELNRALHDHELIKVKINLGDRDGRKQIFDDIFAQSGAELIQSIGKTIVLFKKADKPDPKLSNILRNI